MMVVVIFVALTVFVLLVTKTGRSSSSSPSSSSSCSVQQDDIRLFGSGGDAGRVELCHSTDNTWRYVCASHWDLATATVACRQLGYES